jgi:hypothetical protein
VRSSRTVSLQTVLLVAFFAATVPNTIEAFAEPKGQGWTALRLTLSSIFTCVLLAWLASLAFDFRAYKRRRRDVEGRTAGTG